MKTSKSCITRCAVMLVTLAGLSAQAATPTEKDFYDLRAQRDKALAQAAKPINDRYLISLNALAKRATQAGDLDTALLIRMELESLGTEGAAMATKMLDKPSDFAGTSWEWRQGKGDKEEFRGVLSLEKGGKVKVPNTLGFVKAWEPVSDRQFKVINEAGAFWLFDYTPSKQQAHSIFEKGALREEKNLKLVPARK